MAKSKSGGTRSYIRGRVGADVYSIGKDGMGKKQQVVRSLAETVANPQTQAQMRGRMIMSTVMQAASALNAIIDHSFDGMSGRQPNISEFIRQNYALIKADVAVHASADNVFGLNKYQEKGAKRGAYVVADGKATIPAALVLTQASGVITITMPADNITIGGLKSALGMTSEEYFTLVGIKANGLAAYERFRVNPTLADSTAISGSNIADVFAVEGNAVASISVASNVITITLSDVATCCAVIISLKTTTGYVHNKAVLGAGSGFDYNADAALPTYPVGSADYLNGGDIFGQSESFNPGGGDTPTPSPSQRAISSVTVNGDSLASSGSKTLNEGANTIVVNIPATGDAATYTVGVADKATYTVGHAAPSTGMQNVSSTSVNVSYSASSGQANMAVILCKDGNVIQNWGTLVAPSPAPVGTRSLTIGGDAVQIGGTFNLSSSAEYACVLTLPEGDELIGQKLGAMLDGEHLDSLATLTAGENSFVVFKDQFSAASPVDYNAGTISGGSWSGSPTLIVRFTF